MEKNLESESEDGFSVVGGLLGFLGGALVYGGITYLILNGAVKNPMPATYLVGGLAGIYCAMFGVTGSDFCVD